MPNHPPERAAYSVICLNAEWNKRPIESRLRSRIEADGIAETVKICEDCDGIIHPRRCVCETSGITAENTALRSQVAVMGEALRGFTDTAITEGGGRRVVQKEMPGDDLYIAGRAALAEQETPPAVEIDTIESDGTPGWYQATACWAGPDSPEGYIGREVVVMVLPRPASADEGERDA